MYSNEKRVRAIQVYQESGSIAQTIRTLGYPGRQTLYTWIRAEKQAPKEKSIYRGINTPDHPRHPPVELKMEVLHRCFELGEDVKAVAEEIGYSRASIYIWRRKYLQKGMAALMNPNNDPRGKLSPGEVSSTKGIDALRMQIQDMQMEIERKQSAFVGSVVDSSNLTYSGIILDHSV